jgi:diaminopimelate epimerase
MKYYLAEACRNTFVLFDCLDESYKEELFFYRARQMLQDENRDDALILSEGELEGDAFSTRMLVLGLDGTFGEFCGNGARACASYLFKNYPFLKKIFLKTPHGRHQLLQHEDGKYSIKLPAARFQYNSKFVADIDQFQAKYPFRYVEMVEPHLVVEEKMSDEKLFQLGRELNQQKELFPLGINLSAWHVLDQDWIFVKTYERGVQRLTKSCGTGAMSCATVYKGQGMIHALTPGGALEINFDGEGIQLKGPASFYDKDRKEKWG